VVKRGITVARASWETASMVWRDLQWWSKWLLSWLLVEALAPAQGRVSRRARRQGGKGEYERQEKTRYSSGEINRCDAS
jgi:hypothetical protein